MIDSQRHPYNDYGTHSCEHHLRRMMIMVDYHEILRLQSLGHNITQIAGLLQSSHDIVREVEWLADEKGTYWPR